MAKSKLGSTRGILNPFAGERKFTLSRLEPSTPELRSFIENYWIVRWDLRGLPPYRSETLPFPSVHIVFERDRPDVYGVVTGKFARILKGQGRAFGIKFRPAMFYPILGKPLSSITNRKLRIQTLFGRAGLELKNAVLKTKDDQACAALVEDFFGTRLNPAASIVHETRDLVGRIAQDRSVTRVEQVAASEDLGIRLLQRNFAKYVGVSPKWVIQRYRFQEAADALAHGTAQDLTELAHELGYFDQSHFIRDFRRMFGASPGKFGVTPP